MGTPHFLRKGLDPGLLLSPGGLRLSVALKVSMSFLTDVLEGQPLAFQSLGPGASQSLSLDPVAFGSFSAFLCHGWSALGWGLHLCTRLLSWLGRMLKFLVREALSLLVVVLGLTLELSPGHSTAALGGRIHSLL